jgi:hypothetical protein
MTFVTFIEYYKEKYAITAESKSIYIVNVVMVFGMQIILLLLMWYWLT